VRINSYGGSAAASDIMRHELEQFKARTRLPLIALWILLGALFALGFYQAFAWAIQDDDTAFVRGMVIHHQLPPPTLDKAAYDRLMYKLANYPSTVSTSSPQAASTTHALAQPRKMYCLKSRSQTALVPFPRLPEPIIIESSGWRSLVSAVRALSTVSSKCLGQLIT